MPIPYWGITHVNYELYLIRLSHIGHGVTLERFCMCAFHVPSFELPELRPLQYLILK